MLKTLTFLACLLAFAVTSSGQLIITAVYDADLPGGLPKGVELYASEDIPDLAIFGLGSANNGGGSDGEELTLSGSAAEGQFLYVSSDSTSFRDFFGFNSDFQGDAMLINGDDAVELFMNGGVIDVFGQIDVDGNGTPWEYVDGWAARKSGTGPDGSTFALDNWTFSGPGGLDGETTNGGAASPVPVGVYTEEGGGGGPDITVLTMNLQFIPRDITIELGQTVRWTNPETNSAHNVNGSQAVFPCNPVTFFSGIAENGPWDYDFTFNQAGFYEYQCDPHVSSDMFGTVTVVDPDAPVPPVYSIPLVTTNNDQGVADSIGTFCTLEGVVHGANARPGGLQFTIIDDGGKGIGVFKGGSDCYEVTEGDRIRVTGRIEQFSGLTQIEVTENVEILSTGNALRPRVEIDEALEEINESGFLEIVLSLTAGTPEATGSSGWNVPMINGAIEYLVRFDSDIFPELPVSEGRDYLISGIGGQFDNDLPLFDGYQILPQGPDDVGILGSVEILEPDAFTIFPNPVSRTLTLRGDLDITRVIVTNLNGQILVNSQNARGVDVAHLSTGPYLIQVFTDKGVWSGKFIKQSK